MQQKVLLLRNISAFSAHAPRLPSGQRAVMHVSGSCSFMYYDAGQHTRDGFTSQQASGHLLAL